MMDIVNFEDWLDETFQKNRNPLIVNITESNKASILSNEIDKAIVKVDDSLGYEDFAKAVSIVLKKEYGSHNFQSFLDVLKKELRLK